MRAVIELLLNAGAHSNEAVGASPAKPRL